MAVLLVAIFLLSVVIAIIAAARRGLNLWHTAASYQGDVAWAHRFLAINLIEPAVNTLFVILNLWFLSEFVGNSSFAGVATFPMAVLLAPALGLGGRDVCCRASNRAILLLGLARWLVNALTIQSVHWNLMPFVVVGPFISVGLLVYTYAWAAERAATLSLPAYAAPQPLVSYARPAEAPHLQPAPDLDYANATPCPHCRKLAWLNDRACRNCGLVFESRIPVALHNIPRYDVLRPLDSGGMSSIYLVRDRAGGRLHVLKTLAAIDAAGDMQWRADASACLQHEAAVLRQLRHSSIVELTGWYTMASGSYMVLEHIPGPNLEHADLQPADLLRAGARIADAIAYLGALPRPVVHGDMKPANIIVAPAADRVVLVDFGSAVEGGFKAPTASADTLFGTPGYAAPEQYHGQADARSDVYGLAATLYCLLTGDDPSTHPLSFPHLARLPAPLTDLLTQALARDAQERPSAAAFAAALRELAGRRDLFDLVGTPVSAVVPV